MENIMSALEKVIPEGIEDLKVRYTLLQAILENQPVGRRKLAALTSYSERIIRSEIEVLSKQDLVIVQNSGMYLTLQGEKMLDRLYTPVRVLERFAELEHQLQQVLGLRQAIIVKGNVDESENTKWRLGKAGANLLKEIIKDHSVVALTGGTTVAKMIESVNVKSNTHQNITVVAARGSVGENVDIQANTLAAELAKKLDAQYELLNIPDNLGMASINTIKQEPHIQKTLQIMVKSDMIIFGLGDAVKMATRRKESPKTLKLLQDREAVAEAFRCYFDKNGQIVYSSTNIGIDLETAMQIPTRLAIAGGTSKVDAILAAKELLKDSYLVLDESAAKEVLHRTQILTN
ncbi:MAG: sugar-binding transcriptional regulator [Cellulosilyticaceae bacterium]